MMVCSNSARVNLVNGLVSTRVRHSGRVNPLRLVLNHRVRVPTATTITLSQRVGRSSLWSKVEGKSKLSLLLKTNLVDLTVSIRRAENAPPPCTVALHYFSLANLPPFFDSFDVPSLSALTDLSIRSALLVVYRFLLLSL